MLDVLELVTEHFFDINNNKLIITSPGEAICCQWTKTGWLLQKKEKKIIREPKRSDSIDRAPLPTRDVSELLERLSVQFITSLKYQ